MGRISVEYMGKTKGKKLVIEKIFLHVFLMLTPPPPPFFSFFSFSHILCGPCVFASELFRMMCV